MPFSPAFLLALTQARVQGDFPPFTLGSPAKIEQYLRKIVAELQYNARWQVEADFNHYGSGYASYVVITIAKQDKSDTVTLAKAGRATYDTTGLRVYASRLAPYWFYGRGRWSRTYDNGQWTGGSSDFLEPDSQAAIDPVCWQADRQQLESVFSAFRYALLTPEELVQPAPAAITYIPTVLADPPYRVFDCFFYWMD